MKAARHRGLKATSSSGYRLCCSARLCQFRERVEGHMLRFGLIRADSYQRIAFVPLDRLLVVHLFSYMSGKTYRSSSRLNVQFLEDPLVIAVEACETMSEAFRHLAA
jgi:hypothetical protein